MLMLAAVAIILSVPLISMQFTDEVSWNLFDFIVAAVLLLGAGIAGEFVLRKVASRERRFILLAILAISFLLFWAELAVGIFGTPLAGS